MSIGIGWSAIISPGFFSLCDWETSWDSLTKGGPDFALGNVLTKRTHANLWVCIRISLIADATLEVEVSMPRCCDCFRLWSRFARSAFPFSVLCLVCLLVQPWLGVVRFWSAAHGLPPRRGWSTTRPVTFRPSTTCRSLRPTPSSAGVAQVCVCHQQPAVTQLQCAA